MKAVSLGRKYSVKVSFSIEENLGQGPKLDEARQRLFDKV
jgi:hypothetical protein